MQLSSSSQILGSHSYMVPFLPAQTFSLFSPRRIPKDTLLSAVSDGGQESVRINHEGRYIAESGEEHKLLPAISVFIKKTSVGRKVMIKDIKAGKGPAGYDVGAGPMRLWFRFPLSPYFFKCSSRHSGRPVA